MSEPAMRRGIGLLGALAIVAVLTPVSTFGQWSAQAGERVRNAFGPGIDSAARTCRGACGLGCPPSCKEESVYECLPSGELRRVRVFECGTHLGCRQHDDCLDRCSQQRGAGFDCQTQCHGAALEQYGFETATSWATGGGPYDAEPIVFEYTRSAAGQPEPVYRCPVGSRRTCSSGGGTGGAGGTAACVAGDGSNAVPVFDNFPPGGSDSIRISGFRSGRVCEGEAGPEVCAETIDIQPSGGELRYGFELAYENADPSVPLACSSSGDGKDEDFIGGLVAGALRAMPERGGETEMGNLLGHLQGALKEGGSLKEVLSGITVRSNDAPPAPPAEPATAAPGVPRRVPLGGERGRLVVPIHGAVPPGASEVVVRDIRCTYDGMPVVETTFRLHRAAR